MTRSYEYNLDRKRYDVQSSKTQNNHARMQVAGAIRSLRSNLGMSQEEFASMLGRSRDTIVSAENGSESIPVGLLGEIAYYTNKKLIVEFK
ncbi:helix-turn-helix domain-containing protein [Companilactobacillus mishanensis]|uniref:Helix-turn-helix transcriptional regulator n=1 Tax=Companilactobacillus mishanensis TaxID=2486008 RepID=A0A5P0ZJ66_9LACO|nr:helix-turn-helix transcriptional regulator [Companilactobacillus mishanensis]MQS45208.1 helix-turn-helix transcriptional regulator [Companilactobacillus mishanensis]MQS52697.1 helix-turn-helix transcriptional regulator [Companilactobacillus mishanensis]MQS89598.1 helix-turn-helix transcriptional regulator [Companilactobacillus mishanensis]